MESSRTTRLTSVERVAEAFAGRVADKVPVYHGSFSSRAASLILGRETPLGGGSLWFHEACALHAGRDAYAAFEEQTFRDLNDLAEATGQDVFRFYWRKNLGTPSQRIDERTFLYGDRNAAYRVMRFDPVTELYQVVERHPKIELTTEDLERQVAEAERVLDAFRPDERSFKDLLQARERLGDRLAIRCGGIGLSIPYDPVLWMEASAEDPDLVGRFLDVQTERACRNAEVLGKLGFRYLFGGGDCATTQGPMYSPRTFRTLMLPRLKRISATCHRSGCKHLFGSDGNLWPVAADLFGASGVDGFYEVDRAAGMDLRSLRQQYPHLTLLGGVSSLTLHLGTKGEVVAEARDALAAAQEFGGILVGCSNQVVPETPPENLFAMLDVLRDER